MSEEDKGVHPGVAQSGRPQEAPALKAYQISDGDEHCDVLFVRSMREARNWGAGEYGMDACDVECGRAKWADRYSPGPVPPLVLLDAGWWLECWGCGCRIDGDLEDWSGDDVRALEPVERGRAIYCTAECRDSHDAHLKARGNAEYIALAAFADQLRAKLPGIELVPRAHAYVQRDHETGKWVPHQLILHFTFPGSAIGPSTYRIDNAGEEPLVWICGGDKPAWDAWRASLSQPASKAAAQVSQPIREDPSNV